VHRADAMFNSDGMHVLDVQQVTASW